MNIFSPAAEESIQELTTRFRDEVSRLQAIINEQAEKIERLKDPECLEHERIKTATNYMERARYFEERCISLAAENSKLTTKLWNCMNPERQWPEEDTRQD